MNYEEFKELFPKSDFESYKSFSEAQKNLAERDKMRHELKNPFYKKISFYLAIAPLLILVVTYFGTNAKDYFNNKVKEIQLEKRELQFENKELAKIQMKLTQKKDSLIVDYNNKGKLLEKEYQIKKLDLEKKYSKQIDELVSTVDNRNKDVELHLKNLLSQKKELSKTETVLKNTLIQEKKNNETIVKLNAQNQQINNQLSKLKIENDNIKINLSEKISIINRYNELELKWKITSYLLFKDWKRIGFNRIKENIDSDLTDLRIEELIRKNQDVFTSVTLTDKSDKKGLAMKENFSIDELIK